MKKKITCLMLAFAAMNSAFALTGKEIYSQTCIACHGADGKGAIPGAANLTDPKGPLSKSDAILLDHIIKGFQTPGNVMAMPAKGGNPTLTDDELKDTLKYVRETFQPKKK